MRKRRLGKSEKREVTPEFVSMSKEILYPQIQGVTGARGSSALSSLEERNFAEVGTFQPSFGFKDFHQAARLHPLAGGHSRR
jgi:hypothetical protein